MSASPQLQILGIVGSLRSGSFNRTLMVEAARIAPEGMRISVYEGLGDIPLYNADVEAQGVPESVERFKRAIAEADGILLATPEYNYSVTGVLKNAIDWASRPPGESPLEGKPAALIGASPGMGGSARAQMAMRTSFVFTQTPVLPGPEVLVTRAHEQFDDEGHLKSEVTARFLLGLLERFEVFTRRFADEPVPAGGVERTR